MPDFFTIYTLESHTYQNVSPHLEHLNGRKSSLLQDLMLQCLPRPIRSTFSELAIFNDSSRSIFYRTRCIVALITPFTLYTRSISGDAIFRLRYTSCHDTHAQFCIYTAGFVCLVIARHGAKIHVLCAQYGNIHESNL